ncbi:hypothetical protein [uncultured Mediterranean phage uvMED]|nr:hypothetical protein [uncultured Mediterranean phage uvMED]BAR21932.1 hypothetical protein [uncultured Mediterranean phage uvMED]BAR21955.1 hypothetical protein [uncultured Mediterranean phage uvMED]BAR38678.1 hypothetical protein [uncultured Mediterranean phage uvMED]BAR38864.1 hypothetical protein [uncultured Mediterranean phage uvMED]
MPTATKTQLQYELDATNQITGLNMVFEKSKETGYILYTDETKTSQINCCLSFKEMLSTFQNLRRIFEYKNLKDSIFKKMRKDQEAFYYSQLSRLSTN